MVFNQTFSVKNKLLFSYLESCHARKSSGEKQKRKGAVNYDEKFFARYLVSLLNIISYEALVTLKLIKTSGIKPWL